ncbi:MAG: DivIVA domain-containing protein [Ilumatobacteraceae bacterium]
MDMSPEVIRAAAFKTVKRGYDPEEVDAFKERVADFVEFVQTQSNAMEARARAAVAKLQELVQSGAAAPRVERAPEPEPVAPVSAEGSDVLSRALLLAQRTADAAIAEARTEAEVIVSSSRDEARRVLESANLMAARMVEDARLDARRSAEDERVRAENEVQALLARRDFLLSDVDVLEDYIDDERSRLRETADRLLELIDRVPGGLGAVRRPLVSGVDDPGASIALDETQPMSSAVPPLSSPVASPLASFDPTPSVEPHETIELPMIAGSVDDRGSSSDSSVWRRLAGSDVDDIDDADDDTDEVEVGSADSTRSVPATSSLGIDIDLDDDFLTGDLDRALDRDLDRDDDRRARLAELDDFDLDLGSRDGRRPSADVWSLPLDGDDDGFRISGDDLR